MINRILPDISMADKLADVPEIIDNLADVLEEEASLYSDFLKAARDKTDIIVNGKAADLEGIVKKEQAFVSQMQKLETAREQIVKDMAEKSGIDYSKLTVTSIIEMMSTATRMAPAGKTQMALREAAEIALTKAIGMTSAEAAAENRVKRLKNSRDNIIDLVNEIKKVNELNSKLIANSLEYINFSINLIASANSTGSKYGNDGKEGKVERRSLFDVKL
ncbi:MAG TPA: flagellar protein FlgN [Clostridiales bacterium]|nr:flagellar protein FlgN [Clostridiales bacterium]